MSAFVARANRARALSAHDAMRARTTAVSSPVSCPGRPARAPRAGPDQLRHVPPRPDSSLGRRRRKRHGTAGPGPRRAASSSLGIATAMITSARSPPAWASAAAARRVSVRISHDLPSPGPASMTSRSHAAPSSGHGRALPLTPVGRQRVRPAHQSRVHHRPGSTASGAIARCSTGAGGSKRGSEPYRLANPADGEQHLKWWLAWPKPGGDAPHIVATSALDR